MERAEENKDLYPVKPSHLVAVIKLWIHRKKQGKADQQPKDIVDVNPAKIDCRAVHLIQVQGLREGPDSETAGDVGPGAAP